jgi:hypothetical protein
MAQIRRTLLQATLAKQSLEAERQQMAGKINELEAALDRARTQPLQQQPQQQQQQQQRSSRFEDFVRSHRSGNANGVRKEGKQFMN